MIVYPNAKINLGLNIIEKRPDGFHNIETVFYPIGWKDILEILPDSTKERGITFSSGGIEIPCDSKDNLCVKAYELISRDYPMSAVKVHLHKLIPIGAGLGGGSSDAAFFIRALNEFFELNLAWGELHHYAKLLGSDCSFFITNKPTFAEGKGDQLESIKFSLEGYHLAVVYPKIHVNTAEAYSGVVPMKPENSLEQIIPSRPISEWKSVVKNDFELSVFAKFPAIADVKAKLYEIGAVYASMSGSGSAVFGIFEKEVDLKSNFKDYMIWQGPL